ncbi:MAG: enoyl-CoA hydratase/isomerase family protein [Chloroflexi bacterium]|nr:enoyl-CoA hydratase/isomerase family protein [Chloroflexota bacterium]
MTFVDYQKKGSVVIITINRPDRRNALGREVTAEITDACKRFAVDDGARVAILTGTDNSFSAGADLREVTGPPMPVQAFNAVETVVKPVIAAVNGYAIGAGCLLAMACDITFAARSATFSLPEIARSIPLGPERLLAQGIPVPIAMELLLTGAPLTAQRAYEVGMVNKVVPDEELMTTALSVAEKIAGFSPWVARVDKEAKIRALSLSKEVLEQEQARRLMARQSGDLKEAVKAFIEKRPPATGGD